MLEPFDLKRFDKNISKGNRIRSPILTKNNSGSLI